MQHERRANGKDLGREQKVKHFAGIKISRIITNHQWKQIRHWGGKFVDQGISETARDKHRWQVNLERNWVFKRIWAGFAWQTWWVSWVSRFLRLRGRSLSVWRLCGLPSWYRRLRLFYYRWFEYDHQRFRTAWMALIWRAYFNRTKLTWPKIRGGTQNVAITVMEQMQATHATFLWNLMCFLSSNPSTSNKF